ncbi:hypothetical protein ACUH96_00800 [Dermabacteraceae bacterium P13077]
MTDMDRFADDIRALAELYETITQLGIAHGDGPRRPPGPRVPTNLAVLDWLRDVDTALGEWCAETWRVLSQPIPDGTPGGLMRQLAFAARVAAVKQRAEPTWLPDVAALLQRGRHITGELARAVFTNGYCDCGGRMLVDVPRGEVFCPVCGKHEEPVNNPVSDGLCKEDWRNK